MTAERAEVPTPGGVLEAALEYATRGLRVVPVWWVRPDGRCACSRGEDCAKGGKHPLHRRGWPDLATTDPDTLRAWWAEWPAANVGIVLRDGLHELDADGPDGLASLEALEARHGGLESLRIRTPRGAKVLVRSATRLPHVVEADTERLGKGLALHGEGRLVIMPPSSRGAAGSYELVDDVAIADAPAWLALEAAPRDPATGEPLADRPAPAIPPTNTAERSTSGAYDDRDVPAGWHSGPRPSPYGERVLVQACTEIASAPEGDRNNRLNGYGDPPGALRVAQLVATGHLEEADAWSALEAAARQAGLGTAEIRSTLRSAFRKGFADPRGAKVREAAELPEEEPTSAIVARARDMMERRARGDEEPLPPPFAALSALLDGGLLPGLHVLVGPTGTGKTNLVVSWLLAAAMSDGETIARYVGLELNPEDIVLRLAGELSGIPWSWLWRGQTTGDRPRPLTDDELGRARRGLDEVAGLGELVGVATEPDGGWGPSALESYAARLREKRPRGRILLVVDYLQVIGRDPDVKTDPGLRTLIAEASMVLRHAARRHEVHVLVVSSMSRENAKRVRKDLRRILEPAGGHGARPILAARDDVIGVGAESGAIEYAADTLLVLTETPTRGLVALMAPKVRSGRGGWAALRFDGHRFSDATLEDLVGLHAGGGEAAADSDPVLELVLAELEENGPAGSGRELATRVIQRGCKASSAKIRARLDEYVGTGVLEAQPGKRGAFEYSLPGRWG